MTHDRLKIALIDNPWFSCRELAEITDHSVTSVGRLLKGMIRDKEVLHKVVVNISDKQKRRHRVYLWKD